MLCRSGEHSKILSRLADDFCSSDISEGRRFHLDGYDIDFLLRSDSDLTVAFAPRHANYSPPHEAPAWGEGFLRKLGASACHVRPKKSCWYLGDDLQVFMEAAAGLGLFRSWHNVMTYGGSMGGFGALAYAKTVSARRILSMNPQLNLGATVRDWEDRFPEALQQDWSGARCRIEQQVADAETLVFVYDPYHAQDRRQVDIARLPHAIKLKIPFVGHMMATHMKDLRVLETIFDQTRSGKVDEHAFYRQIRARRSLPQHQSRLLKLASPSRKVALEEIFTANAVAG